MRRATDADIAAAMLALVAMREKNPNRQMKYADGDTAMRYMLAARDVGYCVVTEGYLILYSVGSPWFSRDLFLIEDIILRIEKTGAPVERAIAALSVLKERHGCVAIITGDTQVGHMAPKYEANGFLALGKQFIKE